MSDGKGLYYEFFTQVGIIAQLSGTMMSRRLPGGLHMSHFSLLNNLMRMGDGKTPLHLANAFQVPKGTMTHTLKVLTERGFISQSQHPEDKRSKLVFLTDEGRAYHGEALRNMGEALGALQSIIDPQKVADILPKLSDIRQSLDQNRDI